MNADPRARALMVIAVVLAACSGVIAQEAPGPTGDGVSIERVRATIAPDVPVGDRMITIVRVDPIRHRFRILTAERDGGARTVAEWVADFHLTGAINAAMYEPDGRSVGLLVQDGAALTATDDPRFGGFVALDPIARGAPSLAVLGRDCPGFDLAATRARARSIVQSYRLLDCAGDAIEWVDTKHYSAAAIGTDDRGRAVLVHVRTPYRMAVLARMLADPSLHLRSMIFVEGGPEASLVVDAAAGTVREIGSYETTFHERDDNHELWRIPNVIGFAPR